jgi:hypothetical protein
MIDTATSRAVLISLNVLTAQAFLALAWVTPWPWWADGLLAVAVHRVIQWEERAILADPSVTPASKALVCALDALTVAAFMAIAWFTPWPWYTDALAAVAVYHVIGGPDLGISPLERRHGVANV